MTWTGTMTDRQEMFLRRLVMETVAEQLADAWGVEPEAACDRFVGAVESKSEASRVIAELQSLPTGNGSSASKAEPPEGIHYLRSGDGIVVYKVQVAKQGSGRLYAKRLDPGPPPSWEYLGRGGVFHELSDGTLLDLDTAKQYGALYGVCGICGRTLTDETSIERGIGPVCEGRMRDVMGG